MKKVVKAVKTTAKAGLLALDGINVGTLKFLGTTLNGASNVVTAGTEVARARLDGMGDITFGDRLKAAHKRDEQLMRVIDGRVPMEDYLEDVMPSWIYESMMGGGSVVTDSFGDGAKTIDELQTITTNGQS